MGGGKLSNKTSEIISYGGGVEVKNIVKQDKQAHLVWGWRIFCSEQARLSRMWVGQGHTPYNPHDITYLTNLLGSFARSLRRSIRVRVQRLVCFYFPYLSDTHGYSRILTDTHGYSWILTDTHRYSQILMDTHGYSQILTDTHRYSLILRVTHRHSWILMDTHRHSQILTDTHRYSQILMDNQGTACTIG